HVLRPTTHSSTSLRHHRHLHSFPTRRSSDLTGSGAAPRAEPVSEAATTTAAAISSAFMTSPLVEVEPLDFAPIVTIGQGHVAPRSEEHTSELQSRGHLVCRLLLEKKKKMTDF